MVEVHYVFEDETAASLQFVPKNQSGLQGMAIIDPACSPDFVMIEAVESVDDVRHEVLLRNALIAGNQGIVAISPVLNC
jgi:hypothetical protein